MDHEPHAPNPVARPGEPPTHIEDRRHVDLLADADLVIHDAQYTIDEYAQKKGWGHTPAEWATDYAMAADARRLALFHHDPLRDDGALDRLVEVCRERARAAGSAVDVFAAAEEFDLARAGASRCPSRFVRRSSTARAERRASFYDRAPDGKGIRA